MNNQDFLTYKDTDPADWKNRQNLSYSETADWSWLYYPAPDERTASTIEEEKFNPYKMFASFLIYQTLIDLGLFNMQVFRRQSVKDQKAAMDFLNSDEFKNLVEFTGLAPELFNNLDVSKIKKKGIL